MVRFRIKEAAYAEMEARYACDHTVRELRLRTISNGRRAYYRQCVRCGQAGRAISRREARQELSGSTEAPPFDDAHEPKWRARKHAEYLQTYRRIRPALRDEYEAYLRSSAWATKRRTILARAAGLCELCEYFEPTEVHHITYARIGNEQEDDLLAVCHFCHGLLHGKEDA